MGKFLLTGSSSSLSRRSRDLIPRTVFLAPRCLSLIAFLQFSTSCKAIGFFCRSLTKSPINLAFSKASKLTLESAQTSFALTTSVTGVTS
jgi:hypothetical protein